MAENIAKRKKPGLPVEKHDTAAWANADGIKPVSKVNVPDKVQVRNAKEYVDTNQK